MKHKVKIILQGTDTWERSFCDPEAEVQLLKLHSDQHLPPTPGESFADVTCGSQKKPLTGRNWDSDSKVRRTDEDESPIMRLMLLDES